jgi:hypothetical protein
MSLKITANSLLTKHFLMVDSGGVKFYDGTGFSGARRFRFGQIECVLMAPDHKLSFQVGQEVFSIPTKPGDPKHQNVIDFLLHEVRRTTEKTWG